MAGKMGGESRGLSSGSFSGFEAPMAACSKSSSTSASASGSSGSTSTSISSSNSSSNSSSHSSSGRPKGFRPVGAACMRAVPGFAESESLFGRDGFEAALPGFPNSDRQKGGLGSSKSRTASRSHKSGVDDPAGRGFCRSHKSQMEDPAGDSQGWQGPALLGESQRGKSHGISSLSRLEAMKPWLEHSQHWPGVVGGLGLDAEGGHSPSAATQEDSWVGGCRGLPQWGVSSSAQSAQTLNMTVSQEIQREVVIVSKDSQHKPEFERIGAALEAHRGKDVGLTIVVHPGEYKENTLVIHDDVRVVGVAAACPSSRKPVIVSADPEKPVVKSVGTGSILRNLHFVNPSHKKEGKELSHAIPDSARHHFPAAGVPRTLPAPGSRSIPGCPGKDLKRSAPCATNAGIPQRKAPKTTARSFDEAVSELASIRSEMEALRTKMHSESSSWRSDSAIWGSGEEGSVVQEAIRRARAEYLQHFAPEVERAQNGRAVPYLIEVVSGKLEIQECTWENGMGIYVSQADAVVRECSGPGVSSTGICVQGCGNVVLA